MKENCTFSQSDLDLFFSFEFELMKNASREPDVLIMQRAKSPQYLQGPLTVSLEITSFCNLSCTHCRASNNISHDQYSHMEMTLFESILEQLALSPPVRLGITGGEPFLHPYFEDIIMDIKKRKFNVVIYTNATLIDKKKSEFLAGVLEPQDLIHVSVDGGNECAHDQQRGKGAFNKVKSAISYICESKLPFRITTVPTKTNINSILELIDYVLQFKPVSFSAVPLMLAGRATGGSEQVDIRTLLDYEIQIIKQLSGKVKYLGGVAGPFCRFLELNEEINLREFNPRQAAKKRFCDACLGQVYVDCRGNVFPCNLFASGMDFSMGNLKYESMKKIWKKNKWQYLRDGITMDDQCTSCELWHICNGGCMALSYLHTGKLDAPDPRCPRQN